VQELESRVTIDIGLQPALVGPSTPAWGVPRQCAPLINLCGRHAAGHDRRSAPVEKLHLWAVQRVAALCSGARADDEIEAAFHSVAATPVPAMGNGKGLGPSECTCFETGALAVCSIRKTGVDVIANRQIAWPSSAAADLGPARVSAGPPFQLLRWPCRWVGPRCIRWRSGSVSLAVAACYRAVLRAGSGGFVTDAAGGGNEPFHSRVAASASFSRHGERGAA
jgi:hypothetical protein